MSKVAFLFRLCGVLILALLIGVSGCKPKKVVSPSPDRGRPAQPAPAPTGPTQQPTVQIKADPSTLRPGDSFNLTWSSTDAERLIIDNGVGTVPASGSLQIKPAQSTTYTATASNRLGSATASTRVTVTAEEAPPPSPVVSARDVDSIEDLIRKNLIKDAFFDYDKFELTIQAQELLKRDADYLRQYPTASFVLEGHCDERGTAEYNLALGDRRAQSVKSYLISLGVGASRLETISYGKERPFSDGHDEAAWAQNRRVHFTLRR